MFCIATFIVFGVIAIFSASFRPLAAKAWHCVVRRMTLRPCDISFGEEMKGKLVGKLIFSHPRLARFINKWIDWLSFIFVALSIWSLVYVANAGLNLWVYDTCNPQSAESCSLSGEACGVSQISLGIVQAAKEGRLGEWAGGPFVRFGQTLSRIPDRLKSWNARDYLGPSATFFHAQDTAKPYALEIIDPSCKFCKKLTKNMVDADAMNALNVSYLLYPIPSATSSGGYKFPHSYEMASYIEAVKQVPLTHGDTSVSADWQFIEKIFAEPAAGEDADLQSRFVMGMTDDDAVRQLQHLLQEIGYTTDEVSRIAVLADSPAIKASLTAQRSIVEQRIRTIKIPTLLIAGRRYDRVIDTSAIKAKIDAARAAR